MNDDERAFHTIEGWHCNMATVYAWLFGFGDDPDGGLYFYMDGPSTVLAYMGWPQAA